MKLSSAQRDMVFCLADMCSDKMMYGPAIIAKGSQIRTAKVLESEGLVKVFGRVVVPTRLLYDMVSV